MTPRSASYRLIAALIAAIALSIGGAVSAAASAPSGQAAPAERASDPLPRDLEGVTVVEKLGARVPMNLMFSDDKGERVRVGSYFTTGRPVLLTFNYSDCEMLCSMQLSALVAALPQIPLSPSRHFDILTITLDPAETPERARQTKERYLERFPAEQREAVRDGWHMLTGDERSIRAMADAVGFGYRYVESRDDYAHPAAIALLSPEGKVTRYLYGIQYPASALNESIIAAGTGTEEESLGFILSCFYYDSKAGSYAREGRMAMRFGSLAFVVLMLAGFGTWHLVRSARRESKTS
jgi:protein SCO1